MRDYHCVHTRTVIWSDVQPAELHNGQPNICRITTLWTTDNAIAPSNRKRRMYSNSATRQPPDSIVASHYHDGPDSAALVRSTLYILDG